MKHFSIPILALLLHLLPLVTSAQRNMEYLDRGVVAIPNDKGQIFISWRLLGNDPEAIAFNLYRTVNNKTTLLNKKPLTTVTNFTDITANINEVNIYTVKTVLHNKETGSSHPYTVKANAPVYLSIPLQTPEGYTPNDASVGDVDGDGIYEIILHQVGIGKDNSHAGFTTPPVLQCYKMDGSLLWTINLGKNIREGAHYTQFMVYDFDGDGKAELAMKTADGSIDGKGNVIGDSTKDWRNSEGYILAGPEFLTMFDGLTGEALSTVNFNPPRHPDTITPTVQQLKDLWGDGRGNRMDRFLGGVAYLNGVTPSLIMSRGYYTRTTLAAWNFVNKQLQPVWFFDSEDGTPGNKAYGGQGNHSLTIADVDGDGKDEIVYGAMTIDDNGKGLYTTGLGHGDALHVTDHDPTRPGLEVFDIQERFDDAGASFRDARTGEVIWKKASVKAGEDGEGPGRGLALNIDPRYPGSECWVAGAGIYGLFDAKGNKIANRTPPCNMGIYWDGDLLSEILNSTQISKWDYNNERTVPLLNTRQYNCAHNNGTKSTPALVADLFGDWREEVIYRTADNKELRIFTTSIPTKHRIYTLMHNPQYRLSIAWQNVAYNQPPHVDYYLDESAPLPKQPNIKIIHRVK